jgi:hypothetical protein
MPVSEEVPQPAAPAEPVKLDLATPDLAAAKTAAFEDLFPVMLVEVVLNAAKLGELVDTPVTAPAETRHRYGLMWTGKHDAVHSLPSVSEYLAPALT